MKEEKTRTIGKKLVHSLLGLEMLQHAEHGLEYDGDEVAKGWRLPTVNHHRLLCKKSN
jgi:hypothetical protein